MALVRGVASNKPCPICLVPKDEMWDTSKTHPLRTRKQTQQLVRQGRELNLTDREEFLRDYGLRDVDVSC